MFIPNGFGRDNEESVEYAEEGEPICNMDSGAAASVLPES